jgi:GT2 family glycosyltransferase
MSELQVYRQPHGYVVLLNWNGWQETTECLESVFRLEYSHFTVIVCDNASSDGSMQRIESWAKGFIPASCNSPDLARLTVPPIPKPIDFDHIVSSTEAVASLSSGNRLLLIQTGANLGFAGGNNVGIRYALARGDCDYVWLLNNNTVVEPDSLSAMVRMEESHPKLGICGSQLRSYTYPHEIQTMGGRRYSRWSGRTRPAPRTHYATGLDDARRARLYRGRVHADKPQVLEATGLLEESYFLYL